MRLFVAVTPSVPALDEVQAAITPLQPAWPQLRWTGRPTWHLTLAFLGEVEEAAIPGLETHLKLAAASQPEFPVSLAGVGAFPDRATTHHVFWAGVAKPDAKLLEQLADEVGQQATKAGVAPPPDGRKYIPHLTLARCRAPVCVTPLLTALAGFKGMPWHATEILLARSYLRPEGLEPRYERLGQWPLGAAIAAR